MEKITELRPQQTPSGNRIVGNAVAGAASHVTFRADQCVAEFGEGAQLHGGIQFLQPGGTVRIGAGSVIRGGIMVGRNSTVIIGERLAVTGALEIVTEDGVTVTIGDDCLFARNVSLRAYDNHPIYDIESGERINTSRPVTIGDHVWLGAGVNVLGGGIVGSGSVVGVNSVVTASRPVPEHCIAVGTPARVTREGIAWMKPGNPPADRLPDHLMRRRTPS